MIKNHSWIELKLKGQLRQKNKHKNDTMMCAWVLYDIFKYYIFV